MSQKQSQTKTIAITLVILLLAVGAVVIYNAYGTKNQTAQGGQVAGANTTNNKTQNNPKVNINKPYEIKAIDVNGKEAKSKITMNVKYAEKADEILIKGTPATAKNGSKFFVLQIELQNNSQERLIVAPLDLLRLVVDDQKRAAEIYTEETNRIKGSVIIEPDSTKVTRVGFVLTPDIVSKPLKLQVGEINSEDKDTIDIKL